MVGFVAGLAFAGLSVGAGTDPRGDWLFLGGKSGFEIRESRWMEAFLREARPELSDRVRWGVQPYVTEADLPVWERDLFRAPGFAEIGRAHV